MKSPCLTYPSRTVSKILASRPLALGAFLAITNFGGLADGQTTFLSEDFESSSNIPNGWTQNQTAGTATWTINNGGVNGHPAAAHGGSRNARLSDTSGTDDTTRLISPVFDTTGHINISLNFWHAQENWFGDQDELKVFYSTNGGTSWTELEHYTSSLPDWTERTLSIPASSATTRIAFEGNAKYGYGACVDDIQVTGIADNLSELSVTATDADASEVGSDTGTWTIARSGNTTGAISVNFAISGNATQDSDYTLSVPSPINFAAGETSKVVTLTPIDDEVESEGNEIATLTLNSGTGYVINTASDDISIYDDESVHLNVLVLGSSRSFSNDNYSGVPRHQKPFDAELVTNRLRDILNGDSNFDTVNVVHENIYRTSPRELYYDRNNSWDSAFYDAKCYSLLSYYYHPTGREDRLKNLKGDDGTPWNYVIIMGDPSHITSTPGVYAKGVKVLVDTINQGTAKPILMMQWPHAGSSVSVDDFGEVTYRVGDSGGIPVAPAGFAWDDLVSKDTGTSLTHPTAKGAYLAAATLYNKIFGRDAGTASSYDFDDSLATLANTTVQTHETATHYTGAYAGVDPYQILYEKSRIIRSSTPGSSTEKGFLSVSSYNSGRHFRALLDPQLSISDYANDNSYTGLIHFDLGRAFGGGKSYRINPASYKYSLGYSYQVLSGGTWQTSAISDGGLDMRYGMDVISGWGFGDQKVAFDMINKGEPAQNVRNMPVYSIWAAVNDEMGVADPYSDSKHFGADVNEAVVSYMMTLVTGRCPIGKNGTAQERERRRIGYETSWIMSTLNLRPPGFTTKPSATNAKTVTPGAAELMSVYFVNAPQSDVTVSVAPSAVTAALVNPKTLTFNSSNHDAVRNVRVVGLPGSAAAEAFDVNFSASSSDMCFAHLSDAWAYTNNRVSTATLSLQEQSDRQEAVTKNSSVTIDLQVSGSLEANTILATPFHGSLSWSGGDVVYTPGADYVGSDSFAFAVNVGGVLTKGYIEITVEDVPLPSIYASWTGGDFTDDFTNTDPTRTDDGDKLSNMMEFAFGTDPTVADGGPLATDGSLNGQPTVEEGVGAVMGFYFIRRTDHGDPGSVSYTVQFSSNLLDFTNEPEGPSWETYSTSDPDYELVKVPFPAGKTFGYVRIEFVP